jgi:hypothetical protein
MKPHKNPYDLDEILSEIRGGSARSAVLLSASLIDTVLGGAIREKMRPLTDKEQEEIFFGEGPLSTFSSRIKVAYALNVFGKRTRHDLDALRKIRNDFAHSVEKIEFDSLKDKLAGFHCIQGDAIGVDPRELFADITHRLALYLIWQIGNPEQFGRPDAEYRCLMRHFD